MRFKPIMTFNCSLYKTKAKPDTLNMYCLLIDDYCNSACEYCIKTNDEDHTMTIINTTKNYLVRVIKYYEVNLADEEISLLQDKPSIEQDDLFTKICNEMYPDDETPIIDIGDFDPDNEGSMPFKKVWINPDYNYVNLDGV